MRKPHLLGRTSGKKLPARIAFLDTETSQQPVSAEYTLHKLKVGYCALTKRHKNGDLETISDHIIRSIPEFWDYLIDTVSDKTNLIVVSHNLNYDLPVLHAFTELPARGYKLAMFYVKGMTGIIKFRSDSSILTFIDNANFFSGTLAKWGDEIGVPKLSVDFDTVTDDQLLTYCINDVTILIRLWSTWLAFLIDNDCGAFKYTASSTAFNTFRHRFLQSKVFIHSEESVLELERQAYHGGRIECLFIGSLNDGEYAYLDVNNMYGYVMSEYEYPISLVRLVNRPRLSALEYRLIDYSVIADVRIRTHTPYYPLVYQDRLCYPVGEFDCTLTTPELKQAIDDDAVVEVYRFVYYKRARLFKEYVQYFYSKRLEYRQLGMTGYEQICKLLINSLYGKFGQTGLEQTFVGSIDDNVIFISSGKNIDDGIRYEDIRLGGSIIHIAHSGESYHSFPAIAAHVTAYARMHLFRLRQIVPDEHVYYMDTDSLVVDRIGLETLQGYVQPDSLGYLKLEYASNNLTIYAPKDYQMGDRKRTKGVRHDAVVIDANTYQQLQWPKMRGMIRTGALDDYRTKTITKRLNRRLLTGVLLPSGFVLPPLFLPQSVDVLPE